MTATIDAGRRDVLRGGVLIGGEVVQATSGVDFEHRNPATGEVQATVVLAGPRDVDAAVAAARAAFPAWRALPADARRDTLLRLAALLREHGEELGQMAILENGTPLIMATMVASSGAADWFTYYAGWVDKVTGEVLPVFPGAGFDYTLSEPYGVVAIIIPWNGPVMSIGMKAAAALAAGNCVVIKPPELTPFTPLRFGELCLEAGFPPGVVNVIPGGADAGDALCRHPDVDKISFTGGLVTARKVMEAAAENLTPVCLELGGKSANLVLDDAPLDQAIPAAVFTSVAAMSGQGCLLPTRLLVDASVYDQAVDQAVTVAGMITVGKPSEPTTIMGPVVSESHCSRIEGVIDRACADGAGTMLTGGKRLGGDLAGGYFLPPTIFGDVDNSSSLAQEEIFGPVLSVIRYDGIDEGLRLANDTKYGLGGYVWTNDLAKAHRVARELEAGWVGVNGLPPLSPNLPFGGVRQSGFGREGGAPGLHEFLRTKNVFMNVG